MRAIACSVVVIAIVNMGCLAATCSADSDCESGLTCDQARGVCAEPAAAGTSSSGGVAASGTSSEVSSGPTSGTSLAMSGSSSRGATSSASVVSSSRVPGSSSAAPSSSQPPACPARCGENRDGGHVAAWTCADGGMLADCVPQTCDQDFERCVPGSQTCETSTEDSLLHCGACNTPVVPTGTECTSGVPTCHGAPACQTGLLCGVDTLGAAACVECISDADCGSGEPVCCGGTCTAISDACGCAALPGGTAAAVCNAAGNGGACISAAGALLGYGGMLDGTHTVDELHAGICGCLPGASDVEPVAAICAPQNGFSGLCRATDGTRTLGVCEAQNVPAHTGVTPAGNCGALDEVCSIEEGGLDCVAAAGVGQCGCTGATAAADCATLVSLGGGSHSVADSCSQGQCDCAGQAGAGVCQNVGAPDCCGSGCTSLQTDSNNCGGCGIRVADHPGASHCVGGQRLCGPSAPACGGSTPYCVQSPAGVYSCLSLIHI